LATLVANLRDMRVIPFTAYAEGRALYAEKLAVENGYHDGSCDRVGYLASEVFRTVRLVIDPGQACAYKVGELKILEHQVERYIASVIVE
jgi:uncharacterized protein (DUF885 family)